MESHLAWVLREPTEADRTALYDISIDSGPKGRVVSRVQVSRRAEDAAHQARLGKIGTKTARQGATLPAEVSKRLEDCCSRLLEAGKRATARELVRTVFAWNVSRTRPPPTSESSLSDASDRTVPFARFVSSQASLYDGPPLPPEKAESYSNGYGLLPASRSMPPPTGHSSSAMTLWRVPIAEEDRRVLGDDAYPLATWQARAGHGPPDGTVFLTQTQAAREGASDRNDGDRAWERWMEVRARAREALVAGMARRQERCGSPSRVPQQLDGTTTRKYRFIDVFQAVDQALRRLQAKSSASLWPEEDDVESAAKESAPPPLGSSEAWLQWTALHATKRILLMHTATLSSASETEAKENDDRGEDAEAATVREPSALVPPSAPPGSPPLVTLGMFRGSLESSVASLAHWVGPAPAPINVGALTLAQRGPELAIYYHVWAARWAAIFDDDGDEDAETAGAEVSHALPLPILRRRLCGKAGWSTVARTIAAARDGAATCIQRHVRGHMTRLWTNAWREKERARRSAAQRCLRWAWNRLEAAQHAGPSRRRLRGAWWRWRAFWRLQRRKNKIFRTAFWPLFVWKRSLLLRKARDRKAATLRSVWHGYLLMHWLRRWKRFTLAEVPWPNGVSHRAATQWYRHRHQSHAWDAWRGLVAARQVFRRRWLRKWNQMGPLVVENVETPAFRHETPQAIDWVEDLAQGELRLVERVVLRAWNIFAKHTRRAAAIGRAFGYPTRFSRLGRHLHLTQEWMDRVESAPAQAVWSDEDATSCDSFTLLVKPLPSLPERVALCSALATRGEPTDVDSDDSTEREIPRRRKLQSLSFEPFLVSLDLARKKAMIDAHRVQLASFLRLARPTWAVWSRFVQRRRREKAVESSFRLARLRRVWRAWTSNRQLEIPDATPVEDEDGDEEEPNQTANGPSSHASKSFYELRRRRDPVEVIQSERVWRAASEARLSDWQTELAFARKRARSWRDRRRNESWTRREWAKLRQWSEWASTLGGVDGPAKPAQEETAPWPRPDVDGSVGGKSAESEDESESFSHREDAGDPSGESFSHREETSTAEVTPSSKDRRRTIATSRRQTVAQPKVAHPKEDVSLEIAPDATPDGELEAALENVVSDAQTIRENRAAYLHEALFRGFSALQEQRDLYWTRTCFNALAKPILVRRLVSVQNRNRLRNWLRICHRLMWFDRNASRFRALWLRRRAFRNLQRAVAWTARNASATLGPGALRRRQERLGVLSTALSRDDIGDTHAFMSSPRGVFLRWRELALQRRGHHLVFRIFSELGDSRRLFRAFRGWSSAVRQGSAPATFPKAIGTLVRGTTSASTLSSPREEPMEPSSLEVGVVDPEAWGERWAQVAPPRGWEWFFPQGGAWWEHDAFSRVQQAGEKLLKDNGVDRFAQSLPSHVLDSRSGAQRRQALLSEWSELAWQALQRKRREMFFREKRGFTDCDQVHRYLVWTSWRPSCYLGWLRRHRKMTRSMQRKESEQRARMTRMETLRGAGSRGGGEHRGRSPSTAAVREAPRVFGAQFEREEGVHATARAEYEAHALALSGGGVGSDGGQRLFPVDESEWGRQDASAAPWRSEWMLVADRGTPPSHVLEAREEEMRRRLAVERELLRVAREERLFAECERMLVYPGVGGSAGAPFRIMASPVENWVGVRVDTTEEGGIAGLHFVIGRGLHPSAVQTSRRRDKPARKRGAKPRPQTAGVGMETSYHRSHQQQPRVSTTVRRSSVSLARRSSGGSIPTVRQHSAEDDGEYCPWESVWEYPLRSQREAARLAMKQVTEQAGSDSDPTLWTSGLWGGRPKDGMLLRVAEPIGTGLRASQGAHVSSTSQWFGLARDELIVGVEVQAATSLGRIRFFTSAGYVSPWFGKSVTGARFVLGDLALFREAAHARRLGYPLPMTRNLPRGPYVCGFHGTASEGVVSSLGLVTRWDRSINPLRNCWSESLLPMHALSRAQFRSHQAKSIASKPPRVSELQDASLMLEGTTQSAQLQGNRLSRQELVFLSKQLIHSARTIVDKVPLVHPKYDQDDFGHDEVPSGDDDETLGEEEVGEESHEARDHDGETAEAGSHGSKRNREALYASRGSISEQGESTFNASTSTAPHADQQTFLTAMASPTRGGSLTQHPSRAAATRVAPLTGTQASSWLEALRAEIDGTMTWEANVGQPRRRGRARRQSTVSSLREEGCRAESVEDLGAADRDMASEEQLRVLLQLRESQLEEALVRSEKLMWRILEGRGVTSDPDRIRTAAVEERPVALSRELGALQENRVAAFGIARWLLLAQLRGLPRLFPKKAGEADQREAGESPEAALARRRRLLLCAREMTRRGMQLVDRGRRVVASAAFGVNPPPDALNSARFGVKLVRARVRTIWRGHRMQKEGWNTMQQSREVRGQAEKTGPPLPNYLTWRRWIEDSTCDVREHMRQDPSAGYRLAMASEGVRRVKALTALRTRPVGLSAQQERKLKARVAHRRIQELRDVTLREEREEEERAFREGRDLLGVADDMSEAFSEFDDASEAIEPPIPLGVRHTSMDLRREEIRQRSMAAIEDALSSSTSSDEVSSPSSSDEDEDTRKSPPRLRRVPSSTAVRESFVSSSLQKAFQRQQSTGISRIFG